MKKFFSLLAVICLCVISLTSCTSNADLLKEAANAANADCPTQVDEMTTLTKVSYEGSYFTYYYIFDETQVSYEELVEAQDFLVESLKEGILNTADTDIQTLNKVMKSQGCVYKYVYQGSATGKVMVIKAEPSSGSVYVD